MKLSKFELRFEHTNWMVILFGKLSPF